MDWYTCIIFYKLEQQILSRCRLRIIICTDQHGPGNSRTLKQDHKNRPTHDTSTPQHGATVSHLKTKVPRSIISAGDDVDARGPSTALVNRIVKLPPNTRRLTNRLLYVHHQHVSRKSHLSRGSKGFTRAEDDARTQDAPHPGVKNTAALVQQDRLGTPHNAATRVFY
jgi:hypothetical protein